MKKLLLLWLFSGSLDGFSQSAPDTIIQAPDGSYSIKHAIPKPDTLRATLIVYYDRGPATLHTKPGFVVIRYGGSHFIEGETYLDDKKILIKAPLIVDHYNLWRAKQ